MGWLQPRLMTGVGASLCAVTLTYTATSWYEKETFYNATSYNSVLTIADDLLLSAYPEFLFGFGGICVAWCVKSRRQACPHSFEISIPTALL